MDDKNIVYWSASTGGFYESDSHGVKGEESSTVPPDAVEITEDDRQALIEKQSNGEGDITACDEGRPQITPYAPPTITELAEQKRREIDAARDTAFANGLEYSFDGEIDRIQTRPQDQINLLGLQAKAQRLIADGRPDVTLTFRGLQNVNRELTASEIDALTLYALGHIEEIYQKSWSLKDRLDAALEAENRDAIEAIG